MAFKIWGPSPDQQIVGHLRKMTAIAHETASILSDSRGTDLKNISRLESDADELEVKIHIVLDEAFQLRFFEKRDIEHLARELDSVVDGMQSFAKNVDVCTAMLQGGLPKEFMRMIDIVCAMTEKLMLLIELMDSRHMPLDRVNALVDELDSAESDADRIRHDFRKKLFAEHYPDGNAIAYQEYTRLVAQLEQITDRANRSGEMILSIARK